MLLKRLAAMGAAALIALAFVQAAYAYTIVYYLGSPSQPVTFTGGVFGQTCCQHFRLFNEATALQSANSIYIADLYYGSQQIWSCFDTYYCVKYQNGPNVTAACSLASGGQFRVVKAYCDTTL